ncbi:hypothetical protein MNBD_ALPHA12-582 [hydrothermal vent metagenome]|uniref:Uncharacterized protein n=1 Tax=hydrothermal vent metagenome TaxID=652676 RepID=A0A3B0TE22_9ZZZZ
MPDQDNDKETENQKTAPETVALDNPRQLFKYRFVTVIGDMGENVHKDPETLFLIGSLAASLIEQVKKPSWTKTKAALSPQAYNELLNSLKDQANQLAAKGKTKAAYAVEIMALSLIAPTMLDDEHIASGNDLLDTMIEDTIKFYRQRTASKKSMS